MSDVTGSQVSHTYKQLLQIGSGNIGLSASFQTVQDAAGNNSVLQLSTTAVKINATTITINGQTLTLTGTSSVSGTHSGTSSGTNTGDQTITLTGDVTGTGTASFATTIANAAVTYAKIQNVTNARLLGNNSGGAAAPQEISVGSGLTLSGTTLSASSNSFTQINTQIFTSGSAATYTPTANTKYIIVEMCGGGGGSGGASNAGAFAGPGGGNSGGYLKFWLTAAQLNGSATYTVGGHGNGGASGANNGTAGSDTTFQPSGGSTWTAKGGNFGAGIAGSASPNGVTSQSQTANTTGTGTVILNLAGAGGTGGLSTTNIGYGGRGGVNLLGSAPYAVVVASGNIIATPTPIGYGSGGNAGINVNSSTNLAGQNGNDGVIIIYEFI